MVTHIKYIVLFFLLASSAFSQDSWNFIYNNSQNLIPSISLPSANIELKKEAKLNVSRFYDNNQIIPNIVIEYGVAYTLDRSNRIIVIDLESNKILKKIPLKDYKNTRPSGLAVLNYYLYISFEDGRILAFSLITNSILWETDIGIPINSAPVLDENKVFILANNSVYAINYDNGALLWNYSGNKNGVSLKVLQSLSIHFGYLMIGLSSSDFLVLQKDNGNVIWKYNMQGFNLLNVGPNPINGDIKAPVVEFKNNILVAANNKIKYLDVKKQKVIWKNNNYGYYSLPAFYNNNAVIVSGNKLLIISMDNGKVINIFTLKTSKKIKEKVWWHNPIIINKSGILLANDIGEMLFLSINDDTVTQKNIFKINNSIVEKTPNPLVIYKDKILTLSSKGYLYIYKVV